MAATNLHQGHAAAGQILTRRGRAWFADPAFWRELFVRLWLSNRERRRLGDLEPRLLRDMGIDLQAARLEAERPFWRLAAHHEAALRNRFGG